MKHAVRHLWTSLALGIFAAGLVGAVTLAVLPAAWRSPGTLAAVAAAAVVATVFARGGWRK